MKAKAIRLTFDVKGEVTIEMPGFVGKACHEASQFIEKALGEVALKKPTAQYYQREAHQRLEQSR